MNWFKCTVWIKEVKVLLVTIIYYIRFKDSFGHKKFNLVFNITILFYLIPAGNIFIQRVEGMCSLKITVEQ